tara:strand:- start:19430 stop:20107 length:678 start_codon:yes stop_codon:yes gene_type:complete
MAYKQNSPYKFLGKLAKGIGGAVGGVAGKIFGGGGGGGGGGMDPNKAALLGGIAGGPMGMLMGNKLAGGKGIPFIKKQQGYSPYTKPKSKSPFKTDAILVKGAGKAASANDTAKYAIIAKSRAFSDMVDSVEKTVNRSSAAQLQKDTTRAKRTARAHDRYGDWKERYDRREHERDRHKQNRRAARDKHRENLGKPPTLYAEYGSYDPTADHGGTNTQGLYPYNYD